MNHKKPQVWLPLLLSLAICAGMYFGYHIRDSMPGKKFFSVEKARPLQEIMDLIQHNYVDDVKLGPISDTAILAILNKLDPHSVFIPAEELQGINEDLAGNFFGIGVEFNIIDDTVNVTNVVPNGPSFKAGIKTGDKFIKVGDSVIAGKKTNVDSIIKLLRGDLGTTVTISILRDGNIKAYAIARNVIPLSSVDASYMIEKETGYIRLNKFSQITYREFMQNLEALQKKGLKKLVLDLRGNGGGVLEEATSIADEFLDGDKLITYTEGRHLPKKEYRCKRLGLFETGSLVVLADERTASASEILIGALQDWDRATVIGRRSFGKGLVQEQYDLSDGSALRLTVARYFTPIGRSIQRPYQNGEKAYYDEIANRYHDGETSNLDSIKNDTTKVFKTMSGKKVYGGGGITPDIFVPLDISGFGDASSRLFLNGTIGDFAYRYYLQNTAKLNSFKSSPDFINLYTLDEDGWKQFARFAEKDSVKLDKITITEKTEIANRIKAALARQLWQTEGYFESLNRNDVTIKKALEVLSKQ